MKIYIFGNPRLVTRYFSNIRELVPLRLYHLLRLGSEDIIITPRSWSPMIEAMLFWRNTRRPRIVQVADGIAFDLNARKRENRRYGGLQRYVFADVFLARQNISDFDFISAEPGMIHTGTLIETASNCIEVDGTTAVLVAGNDPFFDFASDAVIAAFRAASYRLRQLGIRNLLLSCPDNSLRDALVDAEPDLKPIGRLIDQPIDTKRLLLVGSPSTILVDHMLRGGTALLIGFYNDPVLARYLDLDTALDSAKILTNGNIGLTVKGIVRSETQPFVLEELLENLPRRSIEGLPKKDFFKALRVRLVLRELHLLVGGASR